MFGLWTITLIVLSLIMPGPKSDKSVRASSCHGLSRLRDYTREVRTVMLWEVITVWPFASFTVRVTVYDPGSR